MVVYLFSCVIWFCWGRYWPFDLDTLSYISSYACQKKIVSSTTVYLSLRLYYIYLNSLREYIFISALRSILCTNAIFPEDAMLDILWLSLSMKWCNTLFRILSFAHFGRNTIIANPSILDFNGRTFPKSTVAYSK